MNHPLTDFIHATLSDCFNNKVEHGYILKNGQKTAVFWTKGIKLELPMQCTQPPIDFENKNGMKNIAGHYIFPEGLKANHLEEYADMVHWGIADAPECQDVLRTVWDELTRLNPHSLGALKFDINDPEKRRDAILGATSAFNATDIQSYLDGNDGNKMSQNKEWDFLYNKIEICFGRMYWVPAVETLKIVEQQIPKPQQSPSTKNSKPRLILTVR